MTPDDRKAAYQLLFLLIICAICLLMFAVSVYDRWRCMDCSETRLFLARWEFNTVCTLLIFGHIWMLVVSMKGK
jgi:hypothetical protein